MRQPKQLFGLHENRDRFARCAYRAPWPSVRDIATLSQAASTPTFKTYSREWPTVRANAA